MDFERGLIEQLKMILDREHIKSPIKDRFDGFKAIYRVTDVPPAVGVIKTAYKEWHREMDYTL